MLANFEKRTFPDHIRVWYARYTDLQNLAHWHTEAELMYVEHGCARIGIGSGVFLAKAGDFLVCPGSGIHFIQSREPDTVCHVIIFDEGYLPGGAGLTHAACVWIRAEEAEREGLDIKQFFCDVERELRDREPLAEEMLRSVLTGHLALCARRFPKREAGTAPERKKQLARSYRELLDDIDRNFSRITFASAAARMNYTPQHFSRVFKRLAGMTFSDYLAYVRVEKASELLQKQELSVTRVSEACGFSNIRTFNRVFKKLTGTTPSGAARSDAPPALIYPAGEAALPGFDATVSYRERLLAK